MDELPRQNYSQIVAALSQFGANVQDNVRTLYSCRINDFAPMFRHKQLVLLPFSPKQTVAFFRDSLPSTLRVDRHTLTPVVVVNLLPKPHAILQIANPLILYLIRHYLMAEHSWPPSRPTLFKAPMLVHQLDSISAPQPRGLVGCQS